MSELKKKDIVFYARIMPKTNTYDILELKIRTVEDGWFVGTEKRSKQAFLFHDEDINKTIFTDRNEALKVVKEAEKRKIIVSNETCYEEY